MRKRKQVTIRCSTHERTFSPHGKIDQFFSVGYNLLKVIIPLPLTVTCSVFLSYSLFFPPPYIVSVSTFGALGLVLVCSEKILNNTVS